MLPSSREPICTCLTTEQPVCLQETHHELLLAGSSTMEEEREGPGVGLQRQGCCCFNREFYSCETDD